MPTTDIQVGGLTLKRKVKFLVNIDGEEYPCISATHVSLLLREHDKFLSMSDVYNWLSPKRGKKRLVPRFPDGVTIQKCE